MIEFWISWNTGLYSTTLCFVSSCLVVPFCFSCLGECCYTYKAPEMFCGPRLIIQLFIGMRVGS